MKFFNLALVVLISAILISGCIQPAPTPTQPTPKETATPSASPSVSTTVSPNVSSTPSTNVSPTVTPSPVTTPTCPSACLYGCVAGTTTCKNPVCPITCTNGCTPGTTICLQNTTFRPMINMDFETGNYSGWTVSGTAFTLFTGDAFNPHGPKDVIVSNNQNCTECWISNYTTTHQIISCPCVNCNMTPIPCKGYYGQPYSGYQGRYIASGYPGKTTVGGLISSQFTITDNYLEFLVAGSEDRELCIGLKINDTTQDLDCEALQNNSHTVRYFTPKGMIKPYSNLTRVGWNTMDLKGKIGVIEIIDASTSSFIEVDDFRQKAVLTGTLVENLSSTFYSCNHNGICEPGVGEFTAWCSDDCAYPSSCASSSSGGLMDYNLVCSSFKLTSAGLNLSVNNTGLGGNHTIQITGVKCTDEESPDLATYAAISRNIAVSAVSPLLINSNCYDAHGLQINFNETNTFSGQVFYVYRQTDTNKTWYGSFDLNAIVK